MSRPGPAHRCTPRRETCRWRGRHPRRRRGQAGAVSVFPRQMRFAHEWTRSVGPERRDRAKLRHARLPTRHARRDPDRRRPARRLQQDRVPRRRQLGRSGREPAAERPRSGARVPGADPGPRFAPPTSSSTCASSPAASSIRGASRSSRTARCSSRSGPVGCGSSPPTAPSARRSRACPRSTPAIRAASSMSCSTPTSPTMRGSTGPTPSRVMMGTARRWRAGAWSARARRASRACR
jgi:hypothetical protein